MNNYSAMKALIAEFSGQQKIITIPAIYVELTGDYTTASLLNQIVFYSDKSKRTDGFFYKTYKEWEEELLLTERQVRLSTNKLKAAGIVETKLKKANGSPTLHYRLVTDVLSDSILTLCQKRNLHNVSNDSDISADSLTVDYTVDNTVDNNSREQGKDSDSDNPILNKQNLNTFGQVIQSYEQNITFHIGERTRDVVKQWLKENNDNAPLIVYALDRANERVGLIDEKTMKPRPTNVIVRMREGLVSHLLKLWASNGIVAVEKAREFETANDPSNKPKQESGGGGVDYSKFL